VCTNIFASTLRAAFHVTKGAIKQIVHELDSEALTRRLKSPPRPLQIVTVVIFLLILLSKHIAPTFQAPSHQTVPPRLIEVVAFDPNDEVVEDDADTSPHDDDHVASGINKLDPYFLQRLKGSFQEPDCMFRAYANLYTRSVELRHAREGNT
jgi:hypothetical protein